MDPKCALCKPKYCYEGITEGEKFPDFCPMKNFENLVQKIKQKYYAEDIKDLFLSAALTEKEAYNEKAAREEGKIIPVRPRIREIAEFAKKIGAPSKTTALIFSSFGKARTVLPPWLEPRSPILFVSISSN